MKFKEFINEMAVGPTAGLSSKGKKTDYKKIIKAIEKEMDTLIKKTPFDSVDTNVKNVEIGGGSQTKWKSPILKKIKDWYDEVGSHLLKDEIEKTLIKNYKAAGWMDVIIDFDMNSEETNYISITLVSS